MSPLRYVTQSPAPFAESAFEEVGRLHLLWRESPFRNVLPRYEELAVGQIGWAADDLALLKEDASGWKLVRAGDRARAVLVNQVDKNKCDDFVECFGPVVRELANEAKDRRSPQFRVSTGVRSGAVSLCEFLALPVEWKNDEVFILLYLRERDEKVDLLEAVYESTGDGLLVLSPVTPEATDFQILSFNESAAELLNCESRSMQWARLTSILPMDGASAVYRQLSDVAKSHESGEVELTLSNSLHGTIHLHLSIAPLGQLLGVGISNVSKIREREESERLLFANNPVPLVIYDQGDGAIIRFNRAGLQKYGYRFEDINKLKIRDLRDPARLDGAKASVFSAALADNGPRSDRHITKDGQLLDVVTFSRELVLEGRPCILESIVDVTEQRRAEERVAHMAQHDNLTNLANRVLFKDCVDQSLRDMRDESAGFAILTVDLDNFKRVNDTLGHPIGDELLISVANRLRAHTRNFDLIARFGGDEFAILLDGVSKREDISRSAKILLTALGEPYELRGHEVLSSASIGVAIAGADGSTADDLIKAADIAMYKAKADGKGAYRFFERSMETRLQRRLSLESNMRQALARGEFDLHYQPLVCLETGEAVGCEALMRWTHDGQAVSPAQFIPVAEETGLIVPLGAWALRQACREATSWPDHMKLAVNLSPIQFRGGTVLGAVNSALSLSGLKPQRLELEITESLMLEDSDANLSVLRRLRDMGVSISMDDFGAGYSSLGYLRSFPFDKIKIDRSFIADIETRQDCLAIVRAVATLSKNLSIISVAEGVETAEQAAAIKREGLMQAQGYWFSKPRSADDLRSLFSSSSCQIKAA